jgi:hypothetical protein
MTAYGALAELHRRQILDVLLALSRPGVSKHLEVRRAAGPVTVRADGKRRPYP